MTSTKTVSARSTTHRRKCRDDETEKCGCLHGTCSYTTFKGCVCSCKPKWTGSKCAMRESVDWLEIMSWNQLHGNITTTTSTIAGARTTILVPTRPSQVTETHTKRNPPKPLEITSGSVSTTTVVGVTSVSFLVIFIFIFIFIFIIYHRRKRRGAGGSQSVNEQRAGNVPESLELELVPSQNNNNVRIAHKPAPFKHMLNASQTPEITSHCPNPGDDVTGRNTNWKSLSLVHCCETVVEINENTGEVGISIT